MTANTKIEWADHTFNPWIGCTKVSPGCDHCYAEADFDKRRHVVQWGQGQARKRTAPSTWAQPLKWNREAARLGIRYRVFCASLADVFDNAVDPQWRADLFALIEATPHLDWLLLTKRIGNVGNMLPVPFDFDKHYPNIWLGATIVNQEEADRDIPKLLAIPAAKRFLSMEPLLGPVDLSVMDDDAGVVGYEPLSGHRWHRFSVWPDQFGPTIDWVIVGGESGPNARPMSIHWARELRDQCVEAGVPFLFKQWGEWGSAKVRQSETPGEFAFGDYEHERTRFVKTSYYPRAFTSFGARFIAEKTGKKAAGRMLDGRTWDEFPS